VKPFLNEPKHNGNQSLAGNVYRNQESGLPIIETLYEKELGCNGKKYSFPCHSVVGGFCCRIYDIICVIKYDN
jgi:hypothetical protein